MIGKNLVKPFLQRVFGFQTYLVAHSIFVAFSLKLRPKEGDVLQFISRLAPDATVLDIGANVGAMTLLFARKCPRGHVYAFEPIAESYRAASTVLELFRIKNATLLPYGIGEQDGTATMLMPATAGVRYEGLSHVIPADDTTSEGVRYEVKLIALDNSPLFVQTRVAAIKIDVEDHERYVLRGAAKLIERDKPLIYCELWGGENKAECFETLGNLGYAPYVAVGNHLEPYDAATHERSNFFFLPPVSRPALVGERLPA